MVTLTLPALQLLHNSCPILGCLRLSEPFSDVSPHMEVQRHQLFIQTILGVFLIGNQVISRTNGRANFLPSLWSGPASHFGFLARSFLNHMQPGSHCIYSPSSAQWHHYNHLKTMPLLSSAKSLFGRAARGQPRFLLLQPPISCFKNNIHKLIKWLA